MHGELAARLLALGWDNDVPFDTTLANILWQYVRGDFDLTVLPRHLADDGSPRFGEADEAYVSLLTAMLDTAEIEGRLSCLAVPSIKEPEQTLRQICQRFRSKQRNRARRARRKGFSRLCVQTNVENRRESPRVLVNARGGLRFCAENARFWRFLEDGGSDHLHRFRALDPATSRWARDWT